MKVCLFLASMILVAAGCVNTNQSTNESLNQVAATIQPVNKPTIPDCQPGKTQEVFGLADRLGTFRVVFCYDWSNNQRKLAQLVVKGPESSYTEFLPQHVVTANHLESLSESNPSNFLLELAKGEDKVKLTRTSEPMGVTLDSSQLGKIQGVLQYGDGFGLCLGSLSGGDEQSTEFMAGTAKIHLSWCSGGFGTSGGTPWELVGLRLNDNNSKLSSAIALSWDKDQVQKQMESGNIKVQQNHHNVCDTVLVNLPGVVSYGILNIGNVLNESEATKCEITKEFLPFPKDKPATAATFRNIYGDKKEEGNLPFASFFNPNGGGSGNFFAE